MVKRFQRSGRPASILRSFKRETSPPVTRLSSSSRDTHGITVADIATVHEMHEQDPCAAQSDLPALRKAGGCTFRERLWEPAPTLDRGTARRERPMKRETSKKVRLLARDLRNGKSSRASPRETLSGYVLAARAVDKAAPSSSAGRANTTPTAARSRSKFAEINYDASGCLSPPARPTTRCRVDRRAPPRKRSRADIVIWTTGNATCA